MLNHVTLLAVALVTAHAALDISRFEEQVHHLADEVLGVKKLQAYLDNDVTYTPTYRSAEDVLEKLYSSVTAKINTRIEVLSRLRNIIEQDFENFERSPTADICCDVGNATDGKLAMCHVGQGLSSQSQTLYPTAAVLDRMRENLQASPTVMSQYFGGEDGVMTIFPARKHCNDKFDPRFRSWFSSTTLSVPKDVVLVIDRSASMRQFHDNRMLIDIANEAAATVVRTLTPDDRVGVIYFSDDVKVYSEDSCLGRKLAFANTQIVDTLVHFINGISPVGDTYYSKAFAQAFSMFENTSLPAYDDRDRLEVILFLTDGHPTDEDYLDVIATRNARLHNAVTILTYGFGRDIGTKEQDILTRIAEQSNYNRTFGSITVGKFTHILNPNTLRDDMATYYNFFSTRGNISEPRISLPYIDEFGHGLITSMCFPVHANNVFRGVTCADVTLSDLYSEALYFFKSAESYAIVMDFQTRLIIHPSLSRPSDVTENTITFRLTEFEVQPEVEPIVRNYITKGLAGTSTFISRRVVSRGDPVYDGVNIVLVNSIYAWRPLGIADLMLCVVMGTTDRQTELYIGNRISNFTYHRMDLQTPGPVQCRQLNRTVAANTSTTKFSPFAFSSPDYYLDTEETSETVTAYKEYLTGSNTDHLFRNNVREAVTVSAALDDVMDRSDKTWQTVAWRYLGLREGVFRIYPGTQLTQDYDHTTRPWYKRATAHKTLLTFSTPHWDRLTNRLFVTLSKALFEGLPNGRHTDSSIIAGAMGMDILHSLLNKLISEHIPGCDNLRCFIIDNSGFIVAHPDFEKPEAFYAHEHIISMERVLAKYLMDQNAMGADSCTDYDSERIYKFYRITGDTFSVKNRFEIQRISGTTAYVVQIIAPPGDSWNQCQCRFELSVSIEPCFGSSLDSCECPCYETSYVFYEECAGTFSYQREIGAFPPCASHAAPVDLAPLREAQRTATEGLRSCRALDKVCPRQKQDVSCLATIGCIWCGGNRCDVDNDKACGWRPSIPAAIAVPLVIVALVMAITLCVLHKKNKLPACQCTCPERESRPKADEPPVGIDKIAMSMSEDTGGESSGESDMKPIPGARKQRRYEESAETVKVEQEEPPPYEKENYV